MHIKTQHFAKRTQLKAYGVSRYRYIYLYSRVINPIDTVVCIFVNICMAKAEILQYLLQKEQ